MQSDEKFTRLWTEAQPLVAGYIASLVPDFHQAEDLAQEVAVVALKKFSAYDEKRPFLAWALGIARYEVLSSQRSHARSFLCYDSEILDKITDLHVEMVPALEARSQFLQECLEGITGRARLILRMRYEEGFKVEAVAANLGLRSGTVRMALSRIRGQLRDCIHRKSHSTGEKFA